MSRRCATPTCKNAVWPEHRSKCVPCRKAQSNRTLSLRHAHGKCTRCGHHSEINPRTGRPRWRCRHCRHERRHDALPPYRKCTGCGKKIRRVSATQCTRCDGGAPRERRTFQKASEAAHAPMRHVPSSIYTQHDMIAASYFWRQAVSR